jgi:hypothetical protein
MVVAAVENYFRELENSSSDMTNVLWAHLNLKNTRRLLQIAKEDARRKRAA